MSDVKWNQNSFDLHLNEEWCLTNFVKNIFLQSRKIIAKWWPLCSQCLIIISRVLFILGECSYIWVIYCLQISYMHKYVLIPSPLIPPPLPFYLSILYAVFKNTLSVFSALSTAHIHTYSYWNSLESKNSNHFL